MSSLVNWNAMKKNLWISAEILWFMNYTLMLPTQEVYWKSETSDCHEGGQSRDFPFSAAVLIRFRLNEELGFWEYVFYSVSFTTCRIIEQIQVESPVWLDSILWWVKEKTRSLLGLLCWESFIIIIVFFHSLVLRRGTNLWEGKNPLW